MSLYDSLQEKFESIHIYSGYFSSLCPFHNDSTPSFFVYEESDNKNWEFKCAACGRHGSLAYLDKYLGSHHRQTLTQSQRKPTVLPRWSRWEHEHGDLEGIAKYAHENLLRYKGYQTYFKKRGIDEFILAGLLGYLDGWATFPVFGHGGKGIIDIVVRGVRGKGDTRYVVHPDNNIGNRPLYIPNWERLNNAQTVYVVYGIIDAISLELAGLPCVTGISGKSLSADVLKPLGKRYIIVPDLGEEREAYNLANRLGWRAQVKLLQYEGDTKDPDGVRATFGNQYLLQALGV